jgi:hypothetical protein
VFLNKRFFFFLLSHLLFFPFFSFLSSALLFGQEEAQSASPETEAQSANPETEAQSANPETKTQSANPETEVQSASPETDNTIFVVQRVDFDVKGRSRPFALMYHGDFQIGEKIKGEAGLKAYIADKTQLLINQRVLADAQITCDRGEPDAEGIVPLYLLVKVTDSWNIIALPYPKIDSNSGFEIIIKARDYNFLGTMSPLRIDLGYEHRDADDQTSPVKDIFKFEIDSDTPFKALGFKWNLDFDHLFSYSWASEEGTLAYKNITGLSMEIPIQKTTLTVGLEQDFILHEENPERYREEYGDYADFYMSSVAYTSWKIPLGVSVYNFGELTYTPKLSGRINYRPSSELEFWRKGPSLTFSHNVGFGRIDWIGNFRKGLEGSLSNTNSFNFYSRGWENSYTFSAALYKPVTAFFGFSALAQLRQWFFFDPAAEEEGYPPYAEVGDTMRGVLNKSLKAYSKDYMISLNLDFPFRVLRFVPSEWFHTRKLRFFDFELHLSPFIDMALMQGRIPVWGDKIPPPQGMLFCAGIEAIVFPAFMRSLYLRASFGYNLNKFAETLSIPKWDELFIGIGHHY